MKKFILLLIGFLPMFAQGASVCINGIYYTLNNSKSTATVTKPNNLSEYTGDIVIPSSVTSGGKNYSVIEIESSAFKNTTITSISLPSSIKKINQYAFRDCTSLNTINMYGGTLSITNDAFEGCTGLARVYYNGTMAEWCAIDFGGDEATPMCYATDLYINNTLVSRNTLSIPEGVTSIGNYTFYNFQRITAVSLPSSGLLSIGNSAFKKCINLSSVIIPNSVTALGNNAFMGCTKLATVTVGAGIQNIDYCTFSSCSALINVTIPNSVTVIGESAFSSCTSLVNIVLPNAVTTIRDGAFSHCTKLQSVTLPTALKQVNKDVFNYCSSLSSITIPSGVTIIGETAFQNCTALSNVSIANTVTTLNQSAFSGCKALQNITLPNSIETINPSAFSGCSTLKSVDMGTGLISIKANVFSACNALTDVTVRAITPPTIEASSFPNNSSMKIKVPCESLASYQTELYWQDLSLEGFGGNCGSGTTTYIVSVSSNNTSMGTVSGGGTYEEGATATVTATPKSGYKFTRWSNGNTTNPYSFTVTSNVSLTAYFEQSSTPEPENSKLWNMSDAAFNSLGTISSQTTIDGLTIYATSAKNVVIDASSQTIDGLSFTHRLKLSGTGASDARMLSFQVDGDCDIDVYLMSASSSADRTLNIDKGSFGNSWKTIPALGSSATKGTVHYTGGAATMYLYSPSSGVNIYAIRVTTESTPQPTTYTVSVSSANTSMGTVSGGGTYEEGATAMVTATPKSGYKFTKWSNGSTANPYTFTVTSDVSLTAYFEQSSTPQPESSTFWNMSDAAFNSLGTISSNKTINGLTIYATSSKNVVIDENAQEIDGLSFTHRLKLNGTGSSDARLLSFQVDGKCDIDVYLKSGSGTEDRTLNIDKGSFGSSLTTIPALSTSISKGTVHYTGSAATIYLYSPSSGVNIYAIRVTSEGTPQPTTYTVSVSSVNTSMGTVSGGGTYEEGATATVTATPKSGYKFTKWSNGSTANPYTFTVTSDVSLTAYFEQSSTPQPESSTFWNFSDAAFSSLGTITSTKTVQGLTLCATSDKNMVVDESTQEIDGISFTHRLKLNGTGDATYRSLKFNVTGDCIIDIYAKSGSSSADRLLNIDKGSFGNTYAQASAYGGAISKATVQYIGGATTIYVYSSSSGINLYGIRVTYKNTVDIENTVVRTETQKILRNGQILILRGDKTYTLQGQEVR